MSELLRVSAMDLVKTAIRKGEITIPYSITEIREYAFSQCTDLESVTIPKTVRYIGDSAFENCINLQEVVFEERNSPISMGDSVFSGCKHLEDVYLPKSMTRIEAYTFADCTILNNLYVPDSVASIGEYAFAGCTALTTVVLPENLQEIGDSAFERCSSLDDSSLLVRNVNKDFYIGKAAFSECGFKSLLWPDTCKIVNDFLFDGCTNLVFIDFEDSSIKEIGLLAFNDCVNLLSLKFPETLEKVGDYAFKGCKKLHIVTFHNKGRNVKIGTDAFRGCSG